MSSRMKEWILLCLVSLFLKGHAGAQNIEQASSQIRRMELAQIARSLVECEHEKRYEEGYELALRALSQMKKDLKIGEVIQDSKAIEKEEQQVDWAPGLDEKLSQYVDLRVDALLKGFKTEEKMYSSVRTQIWPLMIYKFTAIKAIQFAYWRMRESNDVKLLKLDELQALSQAVGDIHFRGKERAQVTVTLIPKVEPQTVSQNDAPIEVGPSENPMNEFLVNLQEAEVKLKPIQVTKVVEVEKEIRVNSIEFSVDLAHLDDVYREWAKVLTGTLMLSDLQSETNYSFGNRMLRSQ